MTSSDGAALSSAQLIRMVDSLPFFPESGEFVLLMGDPPTLFRSSGQGWSRVVDPSVTGGLAFITSSRIPDGAIRAADLSAGSISFEARFENGPGFEDLIGRTLPLQGVVLSPPWVVRPVLDDIAVPVADVNWDELAQQEPERIPVFEQSLVMDREL